MGCEKGHRPPIHKPSGAGWMGRAGTTPVWPYLAFFHSVTVRCRMAVTALILAIVAPLGVGWWTFRRFEAVETALRRASKGDLELGPVLARLDEHAAGINALMERLEDQEEKTRGQTLAIAEGIEHVDRAERRVRAAVARARKRMADLGYEDEGLEAEAKGIRELDGEQRELEGMQPVPDGVEGPEGFDVTDLPGEWF